MVKGVDAIYLLFGSDQYISVISVGQSQTQEQIKPSDFEQQSPFGFAPHFRTKVASVRI